MVPLVRDLFWKDVHQPEQHDPADGDDEDHEEGDVLCHRVFHLGGHQRRMRDDRERQCHCGGEHTDEDGPRPSSGVETR
jgi:hypothetical protein